MTAFADSALTATFTSVKLVEVTSDEVSNTTTVVPNGRCSIVKDGSIAVTE